MITTKDDTLRDENIMSKSKPTFTSRNLRPNVHIKNYYLLSMYLIICIAVDNLFLVCMSSSIVERVFA